MSAIATQVSQWVSIRRIDGAPPSHLLAGSRERHLPLIEGAVFGVAEALSRRSSISQRTKKRASTLLRGFALGYARRLSNAA